jgi:nitrate/nitrite-specific signal transduction histidine kinase
MYIPTGSRLSRLKWLTVLAPVAFLGLLEALRRLVATGFWDSWPGYLILGAIVLLATVVFADAIFRIIERMQASLAQQNRELLALHEAGLAITGELDLETVLQTVVDEARDLAGARYGALTLLGGGGTVEAFLTSGLDRDLLERLGPAPANHGLLGVVLNEGRALRMADLTQDRRATGFPEEHPAMHSLLAVPIRSHGRILGSLYLTEKANAEEFDASDEDRLDRFATQAAVAIESARLHRRVQVLAVTEERERIAREMHDSLAQVLGYVNTKAQAAQALLDGGQSERAATQIGQLAQAARDAYADVRENILGLRTSIGPERTLIDTLRDYLQRWQDQNAIAAELDTGSLEPGRLGLSPMTEIQLLRILQEALANVRKHAEATSVLVTLRAEDGEIAATIADNGRGFDPTTIGRSDFPRFGLATMRERAEAVGGALEIDAVPGQGTTVRVRVPRLRETTSRRAGARAGTKGG